jgi:hypothetical protein
MQSEEEQVTAQPLELGRNKYPKGSAMIIMMASNKEYPLDPYGNP